MTSRPFALRVFGVSHSYGARKALDDVSFCVEDGGFTVLLGLNGAGKSTLFSLITRLYSARCGRIEIFAHDVARESSAALRRLGVVFQARTLDLELSLAQNLLYHLALHGIGGRKAKERAQEALARAGLWARAKEKARGLSGGQMRRLEIARALSHQPRLLLLDEPTVGLDVKARAEILAHVRDLVRNQGLAVLWTTHLIDEVEMDDSIIVLHQGKVLADGTAKNILALTGAASISGAFERLAGAAQAEAAS